MGPLTATCAPPLTSTCVPPWSLRPVPDFTSALAWGCWAVPLLVAEILIQLQALRQQPV